MNTKFSFQVIEEKDYPPTANAGEDKVVYLPINQVTLHGNQSSDDHGIVSWEWTLNEGKYKTISYLLCTYFKKHIQPCFFILKALRTEVRGDVT